MSAAYYDRKVTAYLDGTPIFKTGEDGDNERAIARMIEGAWGCELHSYGALAPVDWWASRDGRVVGFLELKARSHTSSTYPTVFLNQRKWISLWMIRQCGPPSIFVVKFTDEVRWIGVDGIDPRRLKIGGCKRIVKSRNDVEPVIEVPVDDMRILMG